MAELHRVSARLSAEALRGWDRATTQAGCTFSGLIEALGLLLDERVDWMPEDAGRRAILVDRERNSRR